jgi:signal transduction histidine kinase
MSDPTEPSAERTMTDDHLRTERDNADEVVREQQAKVQDEADEVVRHAREVADAVLVVARHKADAFLDSTGPRTIVAEERVVEDAALRDERAAADASLEREREVSTAALLRLLPMEREQTDRSLLTERRRSDSEVAHRDDFLGIVSHDLRNLLSGIVLATELLGKETPETLAVSARIQRYAARMNRLIGDLVDVASIDAGKLMVSRAPRDAAVLIEDAVDMFGGLATGKGIALESRLAARPMMASFDHDRMLQVLANLITNAIKFTPTAGTVEIHAAVVAGNLQVAIVDTGVGIAADKLERVFERFWQVGGADHRGVGLGLYISRCIVQAHGGTIWAESTLGKGSTFTFTLASIESR